MADRTTDEAVVVLNSVAYPIVGPVFERQAVRFPSKVIFGDSDFANEAILSNWIINDQRGGMLIEEMDESVHLDRFWWSGCETRFRNSITLPPLVTNIRASGKFVSPTGHTDPSSQWLDEAQAYNDNTGDYASTDDSVAATAWSTYLEFTFASATVDGIRVYVSGATADINKIDIDAYYNSQWNVVTDETSVTQSAWQYYYLAAPQTCTKFRVRLYNSDASPRDAYIHDVDIITSQTTSTSVKFCNFNGELYCAFDDKLLILDETNSRFKPINTSITGTWVLAASVTALVTSVGNSMYAVAGDGQNYYHVTTAGVVTAKNKAMTHALHHNQKLYLMDSAGLLSVSADPNGGAPTWADKSSLADVGLADNDVQNIIETRDVAGTYQLYAVSKKGLHVWASGDNLWLETDFQFSDHPQGGQGVCVWQGALYISAGLEIKRYVIQDTASITPVGLNLSDGLPGKVRGRIKKLVNEDNEMFSVVDASGVSAANYSCIYRYNGRGWHMAAEGAAGKVMNEMIVSSAGSEYRAYYDYDGLLYHINLQRDVQKPKQISAYTYAAAGIHYTPNFDAGAVSFPKTAKKLTLFCEGLSANETITVSYRIDHADTTLEGNWTALGSAIVADGQTELELASGAGLVFYSIQFKFALARGGTNTNSPIMMAATLSYSKRGVRKRAFDFTISTAEASKVSSTPKALYDLLQTAIDLKTFPAFTFRGDGSSADLLYVQILNYRGWTNAARNWEGEFYLQLVET